MSIDRRAFLGTLALAPALAACAGASGASGSRGARAATPAPGAASKGSEAALAAVRSHPLPAGTEPAFVFRAAAARPGER